MITGGVSVGGNHSLFVACLLCFTLHITRICDTPWGTFGAVKLAVAKNPESLHGHRAKLKNFFVASLHVFFILETIEMAVNSSKTEEFSLTAGLGDPLPIWPPGAKMSPSRTPNRLDNPPHCSCWWSSNSSSIHRRRGQSRMTHTSCPVCTPPRSRLC